MAFPIMLAPHLRFFGSLADKRLNLVNPRVGESGAIRTSVLPCLGAQICKFEARLLRRRRWSIAASFSVPPLDLTEANVYLVLEDAKTELAQIFDTSVGITGEVDLAELDGPFVKLRLRGRFWHKRSTVLERLGQYLKNRIPEVLEVDIEEENQLDDSPENF